MSRDSSPFLTTGLVRKTRYQRWAVRSLALLCACSLSIGAHYGREFLGPLKSRLALEIGLNNIDFSVILASYSVNNTWTPLVAGLLTSRLGTARTSLLATSLILAGQCILMLGRHLANVTLMAAGLFTFGLGISPVSVVQETIIVRFFSEHNLGIFVALGLLLGKSASFFAALTSFPLSEINPLYPFVVSTLLAAFSFTINLLYLFGSGWLGREAGLSPENADASIMFHEPGMYDSHRTAESTGVPDTNRFATVSSSSAPERNSSESAHDNPYLMNLRKAEEAVAKKKHVILNDITTLGDIFWIYLLLNVMCGMIWSPFTHIAANLFSVRYGYTEAQAGWTASFLHAGSIVLYPICGYITDYSHQEFIVYKLTLLSSVFTLMCYLWLLLPPTLTRSALPGVILFGTGQGFATLLLVLLVPRIVHPKYIPTALGAHKSLESAGATISLTVVGIILQRHTGKSPLSPPPTFSSLLFIPTAAAAAAPTPTPEYQAAIRSILVTFFLVNALQLACVLALWEFDRRDRALLLISRSNADEDHSGEAEYSQVPLGPESNADQFDDHTSITLADSVENLSDEVDDNETGLQPHDSQRLRTFSIHSDTPLLVRPHNTGPSSSRATKIGERNLGVRRGRVFFALSGLTIIGAWVVYVTTLVLDIKKRRFIQ